MVVSAPPLSSDPMDQLTASRVMNTALDPNSIFRRKPGFDLWSIHKVIDRMSTIVGGRTSLTIGSVLALRLFTALAMTEPPMAA